MFIQYTLTMPNKGSWDGKWTGEGICYAVCRRYAKDPNFTESNWSYHWDDGWSAKITAKKITAKEASGIRKKSAGFCGYDWMIDSIETNGEIKLTEK